jgi:SAM-dependent methyltransferase
MHEQAKRFTEFVKRVLPEFFTNKKVLDVGSGDINGNNRFLFENCSYEGNDVYPARNVTVVSKTSALTFEDETFDTICSTECFEHDPEYKESLQKIVNMLKPGGLFFFTCASTGRPEHGTRRTTPRDSYGTIGNVEGWTDYYKNLTLQDLDSAINLDKTFKVFGSYYNTYSKDLYFFGIKNGETRDYTIPNYTEASCIKWADKNCTY